MAKKKSSAAIPAMVEDKKWRTESDLRTIREAEAIKSDKARMSACKKLAVEEQKALSKVCGIGEKPVAKRKG